MAIEICPVHNVEEMATFYQNRAAAYEQLVIEMIKMMTSRKLLSFAIRKSCFIENSFKKILQTNWNVFT